MQRGELWFFNTRREYPYVFKPKGEDHTNRLQALDLCSDSVETKPVIVPEIRVGFTYSLPRLTECMNRLGWEQTL